MAGNLRTRLAHIREHQSHECSSRKNLLPITKKNTDQIPAGWSKIQDGLRFKETIKSTVFHEDMLIQLSAFSGHTAVPEIALRNLLFFDLETTGLSGGSGTVAFLAALGGFKGDGILSVRQYFMDDYPAEPFFLQILAGEFGKAEAVITYNGSSFDMPLYSVRCIMNGINPAPPSIHVDALHAARRLWRRTIGNCSLVNLENEILNLRREGDIPGSEVPEVWFEFLKYGKTDRLEQVFLHNELDVRSLATLFLIIHDAAQGSGIALKSDPVGLAALQARLNEKLAEQTLCAALRDGNTRATRPLMKLYTRQSRQEEKIALIPMLPDDPAGLFSKSVYAERLLGNIVDSIYWAERAEAEGKGWLRRRSQRRLQRLIKKLPCI